MPKRLCVAFGPGCTNDGFTVGGRSRCPAHSKKWRKTPQMQARSSFYSTPRWRRLRAQVLKEEPLCRVCGVNPSTQADHIIGFGEGGPFYDRANLRGICGPCHTRRTASQGGKAAKAKRRRNRQ